MTAPAVPQMTTDRQPGEVPAIPMRAAPPLRAQPNVSDAYDRERINLVRSLSWEVQDVAYLQRDRQVEENIRMLLGRQWEVFSPHLGRFVDVTSFMTDQERAWRQRPVINKLFFWFMLTHARLTENDPIIGFRPATSDRLDAMLAEVMDPIFKTVWDQAGMGEVIDRLIAWIIPGGRAFLKSRVDFDAGEFVEYQDPMGGVFTQREGAIAVDVLSPLEARGTWDNQPWHKKRWHTHRSFLSVGHIAQQFGVAVQPDPVPQNGIATQAILTRLLFGNGYWGAGTGRSTTDTGNNMITTDTEGLVCVDERWEKPSNEYPQGRLTIVTGSVVLYDGPRPFQYPYTSPIRCFDYVNVPGRQQGSSPQEFMNPLQRTWNRGWQQLFEHRALVTNPIINLNAAAGIKKEDFESRPGNVIVTTMLPGVDAFKFVSPPPISGDVWKIQGVIADLMDIFGNMQGASGSAPTSDASGDLVEALRFNSDRYTVPTAKRMVRELARLCEDWMPMLKVLWPEEKIITYSGEDNVSRVVQVLPQMWDGKVNVIPDMESMLPESQGERRKRVKELYLLGAFGPAGSPESVRRFLEFSRFPHLSRAVRPGGIDRVTAETQLGMMLQRVPAAEVPLFPWYNAAAHCEVYREYMASPDFPKLDDAMQAQLAERYALLEHLKQLQRPPLVINPETGEPLAPPPTDQNAPAAPTPIA